MSAAVSGDDDALTDQARRCLGLEVWQDVPEGSIVTRPDSVRCCWCGRAFKAEDPE